jgi:anti-sigma B factor antagonist
MGAGAAFGAEIGQDGATVTITVRGDLDLATAPRLREACEDAAGRDPETVRIDFGGLTFLDSSGISVLVQAQRDLDARGASLVLHRVGDRTARVLEIAGLAEFFARSDQPAE